MKIAIYQSNSNSMGSQDVPTKFIIDKINYHLIWEVITAENANLRQGTHKTKARGEVRGGGAKPWKQKGTGRARAGSIRSPIWVGGGVAFGPKPRNYRQKITKNKKSVGYLHIIAKKIKEKRLVLFDGLKTDKISTSHAFSQIEAILKATSFYDEYSKGVNLRNKTNDGRRNITIVSDEDNLNIKKSLRGLPWVNLIHSQRLAARPILYNHALFFTEKAFEKLATIL